MSHLKSDGAPILSLQYVLDSLSQFPQFWNTMRWLLEAGYVGEYAAIATALAPAHDATRRFLDFGCGTGAFADRFPATQYVGVDLSLNYLRHAISHQHGRFLASSVAALALADQHFDAALVLGILHHLPDHIACRAMGELYRVLRPNATVLVIEDIHPPDPWNIAGHLLHWLDRGGYIRNEQEYRTIFGAGFRIERSYAMRSGICDYGVYVLRRNE